MTTPIGQGLSKLKRSIAQGRTTHRKAVQPARKNRDRFLPDCTVVVWAAEETTYRRTEVELIQEICGKRRRTGQCSCLEFRRIEELGGPTSLTDNDALKTNLPQGWESAWKRIFFCLSPPWGKLMGVGRHPQSLCPGRTLHTQS